ncbi:hypothetical protein HYFRA_00012924 [Hymenoscyphus fraxineus]|uniref:DUF7732 domain-containing protein n=1 Tax=Hymenoscyphus fraxineus TaxID=746836 RepID=A0A9N9PYQ2_9HELO|nr:hypothetical protein HYFRA_00012924 [Hymenoscyphus fraxineus]
MRISNFVAVAWLACQTSAFALPSAEDGVLIEREEVEFAQSGFVERDLDDAEASQLYKRKGGGGGGGKGGGGSSSGGSSSGSGSGRGSSGGSSSGSRGSGSNVGGASRSGSGAPRGFGGGRYYGGGAATPYSSGGRSPGGILPLAVGVVGIGAVVALASYPGSWPYGLYSYPYSNPYTYYNRTGRRNRTATSTSASPTATPTLNPRNLYERQDDGQGVNETKPVDCVCAAYAVCGCDDNGNSTFLADIIGDGTNLNASLVTIAVINGTEMFVLNGTLPNGTTAADPNAPEDAESGASTTVPTPSLGGIFKSTGYLFMVALVGCTVFLA